MEPAVSANEEVAEVRPPLSTVSKVKHLVVDSVGFIKCANLQSMGENVYTLEDVVAEIRDAATRQRLQVLPYELVMKQPNQESLKAVTDFAKKTGDFASLSATDLKVLALTYMLEVEHKGSDHLKTEPVVVKTIEPTLRPLQNPKEIIGFHTPAPKPKGDGAGTEEADKDAAVSELDQEAASLSVNDSQTDAHNESSSEGSNESESDDDETDSDEEVSDSDWITPDNLSDALLKMGASEQLPSADGDESIQVACLTTDFAMQNVLLHMGLKVISLDGLIIRRLKSYTLRCRSCFATTSVMTKKFCPRCGNDSLHRVAVTVNPDGTTQIHLSQRKLVNKRGLKHSIAAPKGGKHALNAIVFEDQPVPHNRLSRKALACIDPLDDDYTVRDSPFLTNDVTSRSALLGVRHLHKDAPRNPNAFGKGKKRGGKKR
uniref:RNA-binding protein NOB1 n=1 Tax=Plectus sambesii TaxID=2011161 RepID=A0A914W4T8_9BILA